MNLYEVTILKYNGIIRVLEQSDDVFLCVIEGPILSFWGMNHPDRIIVNDTVCLKVHKSHFSSIRIYTPLMKELF